MNYQCNFFQLVDNDAKIEADQTVSEIDVDICPVCGDEIMRNGRCRTCYTCGWSSCDI